MVTDIFSDQFRAELIRQAMHNGARDESLEVAQTLSPQLLVHWLQQAADGVAAFALATAQVDATSRHNNRHFRILFESSHDAIMLLTETGFFDCNPSTLKMFGLSTINEFVRLHPSELSPPIQSDGRPSLEAANERIARAMQTGSDHFEWLHRRSSGEVFEADVLLSRYLEAGRPILQATVRDISQLKRVQRELMESHAALASAHAAVQRHNAELERLCMTDQLTGLFNRRKLDEVLNEACTIAKRDGRGVSVILADLDRFKRVNDTFGHQGGDAVLCEVATRIAQTARETDVVGRWGGEEFLVVCRGTGSLGARTLANRMRRTVELRPFRFGGSCTCSFGVAAFDSTRGIETMLREADDALYEAKAAGRNRVVVHKSRLIPALVAAR